MSSETAVRVTGKIEEHDFVRAQWLHLRPRRVIAFAGVFCLLLMVVVSAVQIVGWYRGTVTAEGVMPIPFLSAILVLYYVFLAWNFRRTYRGFKAIQLPVEIEITEDTFQGRSAHGEARLPWDLFRSFKENKHLFLLYQSPVMLHILPKSLFASPEDVDRARDIFTRKLG